MISAVSPIRHGLVSYNSASTYQPKHKDVNFTSGSGWLKTLFTSLAVGGIVGEGVIFNKPIEQLIHHNPAGFFHGITNEMISNGMYCFVGIMLALMLNVSVKLDDTLDKINKMTHEGK